MILDVLSTGSFPVIVLLWNTVVHAPKEIHAALAERMSTSIYNQPVFKEKMTQDELINKRPEVFSLGNVRYAIKTSRHPNRTLIRSRVWLNESRLTESNLE